MLAEGRRVYRNKRDSDEEPWLQQREAQCQPLNSFGQSSEGRPHSDESQKAPPSEKGEALTSRRWRNRERGDPCDREVSRKEKIVTDTEVGNTEKRSR